MPKEVGTTSCSTCSSVLKLFAISPEDHGLLKQTENCDEECTGLHPWQENCRVCAKVRADQWLASRLQDAAGLGPEKPSLKFKTELQPTWLEEVCDLVWGKR